MVHIFIILNIFRCLTADLGADIVIQSFHKTLPSMTQTAVLHICSDMADVEKIRDLWGFTRPAVRRIF